MSYRINWIGTRQNIPGTSHKTARPVFSAPPSAKPAAPSVPAGPARQKAGTPVPIADAPAPEQPSVQTAPPADTDVRAMDRKPAALSDKTAAEGTASAGKSADTPVLSDTPAKTAIAIDQEDPSTYAASLSAQTPAEKTGGRSRPAARAIPTQREEIIIDDTMEGPPPSTMPGYIPYFLMQNIGKNVRAEFIIGSDEYVDKTGVITEVGVNYFVLNDTGSRAFVMCDMYSVKFVTIPYAQQTF